MPRHSGFAKDPSVGAIVASMVGVVALVWFVLWLGNGSEAGTQIRDEETVLSGFVTLLPRAETWLGIDVLLSEDALGAEHANIDGVSIDHAMVGSPAYNAGLRGGDVVIRVDGKAVRRPYQLGNAISGHKKGETVSVTVDRWGRQRKFHVTLDSRPLGTLAAATTPQAAAASWLGVDVQAVDELMVERFSLPDRRGVIVADVYPGSPAAASGLVQGDVIRRMGGTRLRDIAQLEDLVAAHRPGDVLRLTVWHRGQQAELRTTLAVTPPLGQQQRAVLPEPEVEIEAGWLGLDIVPLSRREAEELGLKDGLRGMVVDDVAAGLGVDAGFLAGDVITAVNGRQTATVGAFKDATEGAVGALVDVVRAGRHIYIAVPPPGATGVGQSKPAVREVMFRLR